MSTPPPEPPGTNFNRRASIRFRALGRIVAHLFSQDLPAQVRDVSFSGFAVETVTPLAPNERQVVRLMTADGWAAVTEARSVYSHPSCATDGSPRYVTGFAIVSANAEFVAAHLIERVTSLRYSTPPS